MARENFDPGRSQLAHSTQPNNPVGTGETVRRGRAVRGPAPTRPCHSHRRGIVSPRRETAGG